VGYSQVHTLTNGILTAMISERKNGKCVWIDVEAPTKEEVKSLMERFQFDPAIADDLVTPGIKSKIDFYKDYIYLTLYFPAVKHSHRNETIQEVDFILGKEYLITVHYDTIDSIDVFTKMFEVNSILKHSPVQHAGLIFYNIITHLYESARHELEYINDSLKHLEMRIFKGEEKKVVRELLSLSRDLIHYKQTISAHEEILSSFKMAAHILFGDEYSYYANAIMSAHQKSSKEIHNKREFLSELRETNDSLLNTRQGEIMRVFTMLAFLTFPLSLIVSLFALPTQYKPIIGYEYDWYVIIGILVCFLISMILYFKNKKWM
jgi:magnesium transporter